MPSMYPSSILIGFLALFALSCNSHIDKAIISSSNNNSDSIDFNFDVSATATYPTGDIKTATVGGGIDIDMIPALDGVDFQSDILVTDADFSIFDLLGLEDSSNEKLFEVVIPQNSFLKLNLLVLVTIYLWMVHP